MTIIYVLQRLPARPDSDGGDAAGPSAVRDTQSELKTCGVLFRIWKNSERPPGNLKVGVRRGNAQGRRFAAVFMRSIPGPAREAMTHSKPTAVDLFCGAGGMTLGFEQAGFDVLAAFDREQFNVDTHRANFPGTVAIATDLSRQTGESLRHLAGLKDRDIDLVFGGPPCQGFSFGGVRDLNDKRNLLVYDFARLVLQLQPKYFVMENVQGLLSDHSSPTLRSFLYRVKHGGYRVVEPIRILNAADFGVPQRRQRTFILGYRKGLSAPDYPEPTVRQRGGPTSPAPTVRDAIADLPKVEEYDRLFDSDVFDGELAKTDSLYATILRGETADADDKSGRKVVAPPRLTGFLRTRHSPTTVKRFKKTAPGSAESVSRYFRLAWDDIAPTIRAGTGTDRGSHTAPRPIHPDSPRCITTREAARLHSIPDWFTFHGTRWHDFRQIGNSVPPFLARAVASSVIKHL